MFGVSFISMILYKTLVTFSRIWNSDMQHISSRGHPYTGYMGLEKRFKAFFTDENEKLEIKISSFSLDKLARAIIAWLP